MNRRTFFRILGGSIAAVILPKLPRCYVMQPRSDAHAARMAAKIRNFAKMYGSTETGRLARVANFHVQQDSASRVCPRGPDFLLVESDIHKAEVRVMAALHRSDPAFRFDTGVNWTS